MGKFWKRSAWNAERPWVGLESRAASVLHDAHQAVGGVIDPGPPPAPAGPLVPPPTWRGWNG